VLVSDPLSAQLCFIFILSTLSPFHCGNHIQSFNTYTLPSAQQILPNTKDYLLTILNVKLLSISLNMNLLDLPPEVFGACVEMAIEMHGLDLAM
jgi:hypothetical protein